MIGILLGGSGPTDAPLLLRDIGSDDIYALMLEENDKVRRQWRLVAGSVLVDELAKGLRLSCRLQSWLMNDCFRVLKACSICGRIEAWKLRSLAHYAWITVDSSPN